MGEARLDERWSHTASILALIANVNRDPKKTGPFKPADFMPRTGKKPDPATQRADISVLKSVFIKQQPSTHSPLNQENSS
ncbi:MAG: hypothetical protein EA377_00820 [Phycisphaerales bacterium]|nr:MAG: hypothetical protein EA377_00820 [Phycisphaerales bacterium]